MKNILFVVVILLSFFSKSQALYSGNIIVEPYFGFPNFGKLFVGSQINSVSISYIKGVAPSGGRFEYMIKDNVGIGIDLIYNSVHAKYQQYDTVYMENQLFVNTSSIDAYMKRLRVQFRLNYHFEVANPQLDVYSGIGFGTNNRTYNAVRNGNIDYTSDFKNLMGLGSFPISMRLCAGFRYFFSSHWGIVSEFGLGGPLLSGGISYKIL
jgi:hypothetical protein